MLFAQADLYPTVDLAAGAARSRISQVGSTPLPAGFPPITNDYRVGLQASYELDLWGKYRTATGAARQDLLASEYARETVRTSVEAGTAQAYFTLVAADVQLALLNDTLKSRDDALALQRDLMQAGVIGEYEFHAAEAERAAVVGDIAVAKRAVAEAESALAALAGRSPREVFDPKVDRDQRYDRFTTVPVIPAGLASDLLERRPDIRQSEAQLAAANMRIDVARADYFPAISLTGLFGSEAAVLRNLFTGPAAIWSIGASLAQPIVGLKAIEANVDAQTARRNQAVVGYTQDRAAGVQGRARRAVGEHDDARGAGGGDPARAQPAADAGTVGHAIQGRLFAVPRSARRATPAAAGANAADRGGAQRPVRADRPRAGAGWRLGCGCGGRGGRASLGRRTARAPEPTGAPA